MVYKINRTHRLHRRALGCSQNVAVGPKNGAVVQGPERSKRERARVRKAFGYPTDCRVTLRYPDYHTDSLEARCSVEGMTSILSITFFVKTLLSCSNKESLKVSNKLLASSDSMPSITR